MPNDVQSDDMAVRSLLMRLYHSRYIGEAFYPAVHVNGESPALEAKGWIERHGQGWRITDAGITAWAEMNRQSLSHQWAGAADQFNELRGRLGIVDKKSLMCKSPGCRNKRKMATNGMFYQWCEKHWREWFADEKRKSYK